MRNAIFVVFCLIAYGAIGYFTIDRQIAAIKKERSDAFADSVAIRCVECTPQALKRMKAEFSRKWKVKQPTEFSINVLGYPIPVLIDLPDLELGVDCLCERSKGYAIHPLIQAVPTLATGYHKNSNAVLDQLLAACVNRQLGTLEKEPCSSCASFELLAIENACTRLQLPKVHADVVRRSYDQVFSYKPNDKLSRNALQQSYRPKIAMLPYDLREGARNILDAPQAVTTKSVQRTNETDLGPVDHEIEVFIPNDAWIDIQFADLTSEVRLAHMAKPWRRRYPTRNSCGERYSRCSKIEVVAPLQSDCLVVVKNSRDRIVAHAYVRGGGKGSFDLDNGKYRTFFISGQGWNAAKQVPCSDCSELFGYFNEVSSFTKSDLEQLENTVLTFTLSKVTNGNFSPEGSSLEELI